MKHSTAALFAAAYLACAPLAQSGEAVVPAADALPRLKAALGKQIDVRFTESFAAGRLASRDIDGVVVYELPEGRICLFGQGKGLEPDSPAFASLAGPNGGGDVCVALTDVSVRVTAQAGTGAAPPAPFYATDKRACSWAWKQGQGVGLWTEQCSFDSGVWDIAYEPAQELFALRVDAGEPYPVLRQFHAAGAAALLPALKAKGLVLDDPECVMAQVSELPVPEGWTAYQVVPTGKRKEAFDSVVQTEVPEPPCGQLGYTVDALGFFMTREDRPGRVLYANLGQDGTMIDLGSITLDP